MLKVVKRPLCSVEAFDFILNAMSEAFEQGSNTPSIKRIIRQGQGGLV